MSDAFDLQKLIDAEIEFPTGFSRLEKRSFGELFYNPDNPQSHDSNHAVIRLPGGEAIKSMDSVLREITHFYESRSLVPRIYPSYRPEELGALEPYLLRHGYEVARYSDASYYVRTGSSRILPAEGLSIRRVTEWESSLEELVLSQDKGDWNIRVLKAHLGKDSFHLLAGYKGGRAVTMGSVNLLSGVSRVDDVMTHKDLVGRGYCRALIDDLVRYHDGISSNLLYLYASNPTAIRIYEEAGFTGGVIRLPQWSAWKPAAEAETEVHD